MRLSALALACLVCTSTTAHAALELGFTFNGASAGIFVNEVQQSVSSGVSFSVTVDPSTPDTLPDVSYGEFIVDEARFTATDLGIFDELILSPIAYFEDNDLGFSRVGLADASASSGLSLFTNDTLQFLDPNVIDTTPNFTTTTVNSAGGTSLGAGFGFLLTDGREIRFGNVTFSSASVSTIPLPATVALSLLALGGLSAFRRKQ